MQATGAEVEAAKALAQLCRRAAEAVTVWDPKIARGGGGAVLQVPRVARGALASLRLPTIPVIAHGALGVVRAAQAAARAL
ncbi:MAG: hypothetical protein ACLP74_01785 [Thermoplasmata archaeon]